jgi:hypothetical protein
MFPNAYQAIRVGVVLILICPHVVFQSTSISPRHDHRHAISIAEGVNVDADEREDKRMLKLAPD